LANILDKIIADKRAEVRYRKSQRSLEQLREQIRAKPKCRNFYKAVTRPNSRGINVIAEVKKASPSAGVIREDFDPVAIAQIYAKCGADAISVDHKNHIAESRQKVRPDTLIFGDIDGFGVMVSGGPDDVDKAVKEAITDGVDAVWPGCDIWPTASQENMKALIAATQKYGSLTS